MIYYSLFHILWHSSRKDISLLHISGYVLFWVFGVNTIDSICDIFERESTGKKFFLPSALSNLFCRTNSSSYSKIFLYYFLSYFYFKNLVFFHNKWNLSLFFIIKWISPKQKLKLSTALIAELLLPGEGSRPCSPFPHLERGPLSLTKMLCFLQRQDKGGFKVWEGLPPAVAEDQGQPFLSEVNGRHCLLQRLLWVSLALAPLKSTRHSLALLVPKAHTSAAWAKSLGGSSRSALFHLGHSLSHPSCPINSIPKSSSSPSGHSVSLQSSCLGSCSLYVSWSQMNRSCFLHGLFEALLTR